MATYETTFDSLSGNLGTSANANAGGLYHVQNGGAALSTFAASTTYYRGASGKSLMFTIPSTEGTYDFAGFGTGGEGNIAARFYVYMPTLPASGKTVPLMLCYDGVSAYRGLWVESDGTLRIRYGILYDGGTSSVASSSGAISAASWARIEVATDGSSTEVRWYTGSNVEAEVGSYTGNMTSTSDGRLIDWPGLAADMPVNTSDSSFATSGGRSIYYDNVKVVTGGSTKSWIGPHTSSTTHTASATPSFTANRTAAATLEAVVGATRATTATSTAAAALERFGAASLSATASLTAGAVVERFGEASLSVTATTTPALEGQVVADAALAVSASLTAAGDVSTPGVVTIAAALSVTSTSTAAAGRDAVASASLPVSVALTSAGAVDRIAAAVLALTGTLTAAGTIPGQVPTTPGFMRPSQLAAPTIRPRGGVTSPTMAALVSLDESTMTAVVSTDVAPARYGVSVFVGGSVSPVDAGLIAAGVAYVWFADDGIHVVEAS